MKAMRCLRAGVGTLLAWLTLVAAGYSAEPLKTENVIVVMTDGVRWREVFTGADESLMNKITGGVANVAAIKKDYWRDTPEARREQLLPFLWSVMAREGQVYGNRDKGSNVQVTNGLKFSYPGFSETLCGYPDPRIDRNSVGPNPNATVLEWLHQKPAFQGKVAAFGAWNVFNDIFNRQRCGFYVNAGYDPMTIGTASPEVELLNTLKNEIPRLWGGEPFDALTFHTALAYFKTYQPRVFFVALGETDEWGHAGRYDEYLAATRRADQYAKTLWELAQSLPQYKGKTTLIFTTDHGRGYGLLEWKKHGKDVDDAENTWMAFLGPDTPALGERTNVAPVTQSQIAATVAALLGQDYCVDVPQAAKPVAEVLTGAK